MSRQGFSGITFADNPLIAIGAGKSVRNNSAAPLTFRSVDLVDTKQVLASHSAVYSVPSNAGEPITVTSTSAADVGVTVLVEGLTVDFVPYQEVVTLDGITPVLLSVLMTRINQLTVIGTQEPAGIIKAEDFNLVSYAQVELGVNRSRTGIYSTPVGFTTQLLDITGTMVRSQGNADATGSFSISYSLITNDGNVWANNVKVQAFSFGLQRRGNSVISLPVSIPEASGGPLDIVFEGSASSLNTELSTRATILLERI